MTVMSPQSTAHSRQKLYPHYHEQNCIHCNQCIHACKTEALSEHDHTIHCDTTKCIQCGFCVKACPTGAMTAPDTYTYISELLKRKAPDGLFLAAIIAPETALDFDITSLPSILRTIGFDYVFDLKTAREIVGLCYHALIEELYGTPLFSPACPAMKEYITLFEQSYRRSIIPLKSAHEILATLIRQVEPTCHIIYITPCLAEYFSLSNVKDQILPLSLTSLDTLINEHYSGVRARHTYAVDSLRLEPALDSSIPLTRYQPFLEKSTNAVSSESHLPSFEQTLKRFKDRRFLNHKRFIEPYFCSLSCCSGPGLNEIKTEKQAKQAIQGYHDLLQKTYQPSKKTISPKKTEHPKIAEFLGQTFHSIFRGREIFSQPRLLSEVMTKRTCTLILHNQSEKHSCSLDFPIFTE